MKAYFGKQQKYSTCLSGWFKGAGMLLLIGAFFFLFTNVGLARPPIPGPHPPGSPPLPGPHHPPLPGPHPPGLPLPPHPVILPPPPLPLGPHVFMPGPPPYPGWFWVPGYQRGHHRVPGHWSKPKRIHRGRPPGRPPHERWR